MNKEAFYINDDGSWDMSKSKWLFFDEGVKQSVDKPFTLIAPPQPNWKPSFNHRTQKWSETATDEEMEPAEIGLTENEKAMQAITDLEIENMELRTLFEQVWQTVTELEIQLLESESE